MPRVLDLAGGTGSITRRLLARHPGATSVVVDTDPVLLAIAAATFAGDDRVAVCAADLNDPSWTGAIAALDPDGPAPRFDAVLTATALHWLTPERVAGVYREAGALLAPGGVLANSDHQPDPGLVDITDELEKLQTARIESARAESGARDWSGWWEELRAEPELVAAFAERDARADHDPVGGHNQRLAPSSWHEEMLREAGFSRTGLVYRHLEDAVVVGIRP